MLGFVGGLAGGFLSDWLLKRTGTAASSPAVIVASMATEIGIHQRPCTSPVRPDAALAA